MKPPSWMVITPTSEWFMGDHGAGQYVQIRVRKWHPGFWLFVVRRWLGR